MNMDLGMDIDLGTNASNTEDAGHVFNIFQLSCEVRLHIYRAMELPDLLNMRRACKQSKAEIDAEIQFNISIDDRLYKKYRSLLDLRVRRCTIINWTGQKQTKRLPTFKYPNLVKQLTLNGNMKKKVIHHILTQCDSLESLTCTHQILGGAPNAFEGKLLEDVLNSKLRSLTSLHLQLLRYPPQDSFHHFDSNIKVFLLATFPCLKSFTLDYFVWDGWTQLFKFIVNHSSTLERVNLRVGEALGPLMAYDYGRANRNADVNREIDAKQLGQSMRLKEFEFHDKIFQLNPAKPLIIHLLKAQQGLETLTFCGSNGQWTINELSAIVLANEASLTHITIEPLKSVKSHRYTVMAHNNGNMEAIEQNNEFPVSMDMKLFADCEKLKTLSLLADVGGLFSPAVELVNLRQLPSTLVTLQLSDYGLGESYKSDLLEFTRKCPNLKRILFVDIIGFRNCAIQYSYLLSTILDNCKKLNYLYVRPILYSKAADDDDNSELEQLVRLFKLYMHSDFSPESDLNDFEVRLPKRNLLSLPFYCC